MREIEVARQWHVAGEQHQRLHSCWPRHRPTGIGLFGQRERRYGPLVRWSLSPLTCLPGVDWVGRAIGTDPNDVQVTLWFGGRLDANLVATLQRQCSPVRQR